MFLLSLSTEWIRVSSKASRMPLRITRLAHHRCLAPSASLGPISPFAPARAAAPIFPAYHSGCCCCCRRHIFQICSTARSPRSVFTRNMATTMVPPAPSHNSGLLPLKNRCNESKSPYVRSHASNPTAWQLWSPETLALAKQTNRLLFVSIGYSACHWCHVMAHESFEHDRIAQLLNENFIPIKIDREERPDIDKVYMDFLQATSGGGGWPLNVFVTPELEPIFGGTYWPGPESERSKGVQGASFENILGRVAAAWKEQEQRCRESARQITVQLREFAQEGTLSGPQKTSQDSGKADEDDGLELELLEEAYQHYRARFDKTFGGFGSAPKFPTPSHLSFLLRLAEWDGIVKDVVGEDEVEDARAMAVKTLEAMARGGIKDQVGTGFARYSVTRDWSLPHFEKMLYDNAQLLSLYLDAWLITKNPLFLDTVHDIAQYLTSPPIQSSTGGFHASEDADSAPSTYDAEHKEGAFYVWTADAFKRAIEDDKVAAICARYWNVRQDGNVSPRNDVQGELEAQNTLCVTCSISDLAKEFSIGESDAAKAIAIGRRDLVAWRDRERPRPQLDDKIVVSWNGLAISSLARTAAALAESDPQASAHYLESAESAAAFINRELYDSTTKTLRRVYREGAGETQGFADDYAFLITGLIDLYEATFDDAKYLSWADDLQKTQISLFLDEKRGGFFGTSERQSDVLIRSKDAMDNAEPSANGATANNLFRLAALFGDERYEGLAKTTVRAFEVEMGQHAGLFTGLMSGIVCTRLGVVPIVLSGPLASSASPAASGEEKEKKKGGRVGEALRVLRGLCRPGSTIVRIVTGDDDDKENQGGRTDGRERRRMGKWLTSRNPTLAGINGDSEAEMVQVCEGTSCRLVEPEELAALLKGHHHHHQHHRGVQGEGLTTEDEDSSMSNS